MSCVDVTHQRELDEAAARGDCAHYAGSATVSAYGSATVSAYGSATVRASGSATVRASGSATVRAYDSATVSASKFVAIHRHGDRITVTEGTTATIIDVPSCDVLDEWVDYHGIGRLDDGRLVLFKGVDVALTSAVRLPDGTPCVYAPGTVVEAPDWKPHDGCGNGLHLSPTPHHTSRYADATRWLACAVDPEDTVVVASFAEVPDKVKSRTCEVLYEVDIDGAAVDVAVSA